MSASSAPASNFGRVPCTVVTGFLGAGKTTLIRNLIETLKGKRLAIIVNEFGDVGIDGDLLKGCGIETARTTIHRAGQRMHLLHGGR
jgi:cobalamin biosynthesis protein CobW